MAFAWRLCSTKARNDTSRRYSSVWECVGAIDRIRALAQMAWEQWRTKADMGEQGRKRLKGSSFQTPGSNELFAASRR